MADTKLTDLAAKTTPAATDLFLLVDPSDTSMDATGTDKRTTGTGVAAMVAAINGSGGGTWGSITGTLASQTDLAAALAAKAASLVPTAVKTAAYTAVAGDFVPVDTTSGAVTITLTAGLPDRSLVAIKHVIQGGTNVVTINAAGSDVFNKAGGVATFSMPLLAQGVYLQYKASGAIWYIVTSDLALAQLDLRYLGLATAIPESQVANLVADLALKAPLASPPLTGTPTAPTATVGTNTTQIATTAFVLANAGSTAPGGSTGQLEYNNAGAFGGASLLTYATSGSILTLSAGAVGDKPLIIKGVSSQSGNLTEWQNSSSVAVAFITPAGILNSPKVTTAGTSLVLEQTGDSLGTTRLTLENRSGLNGALFENVALGLVDFAFKGLSTAQTNIRYEGRAGSTEGSSNGSAGELQVIMDAASSNTLSAVLGLSTICLMPNSPAHGLTGSPGRVGINALTPAGKFHVVAEAATTIGEIIQGAASQSADLSQWRNSTPAVLYGHDKLGRPYSLNTTPTIAAGAGAGTSPTVSIAGTDTDGVVTITTGTSPTLSATVATITLSAAYAAVPKTVILTPSNVAANALTGAGKVFADSTANTTTTWALTVGSTALAASTTYKFAYKVNG